jgi:hypothetical protein
MGLEEAFQISVDESSAQEIQTVEDAAALIDKLIAEKDAWNAVRRRDDDGWFWFEAIVLLIAIISQKKNYPVSFLSSSFSIIIWNMYAYACLLVVWDYYNK